MDLLLSPELAHGIFLVVVMIMAASLSLIYSFRIYKQKPKLPPGNVGWPVIGETLQYVLAGRKGCPEKFIADRMKKFSDNVFKTSIAGENVAVLCGPSGNKLLFSNENKLVVSWRLPYIHKIFNFSQNGTPIKTETKPIRFLVSDVLKPEALKNYVPIMDSLVNQHLETDWLPYNQVNVFPLTRKLAFAISCSLLMNIVEPGHVAKLAHHFYRVTTGIMSVPINFPGTAFHRAIKAAALIRNELVPVIRQRRSELSGRTEVCGMRDLLSHLVLATDDDGRFMSEEEIANKILGLLLASHDTPSSVMTFIVYFLADHPQVYSQVLKEQSEIANQKGGDDWTLNWEDIQKMKYSWNVANEVMRLAPPSLGAFKEVINDFTYAGFDIPKGWKTLWNVNTTNRNPEYFPDPEKFDPSRFEGDGPMPFTFVPFGGGPRMCPGNEFARMEIVIFMHHLVRKFKWEKVMANEKIVYDPFATPANHLPVRLFRAS